jgi:hypothetical protein
MAKCLDYRRELVDFPRCTNRISWNHDQGIATIIAAVIAGAVAIAVLYSRPVKHTRQEITGYFVICFSREAFRRPFGKEHSEEDFFQASEDTITAINTGKLLDRKDRSIIHAEGGTWKNFSMARWFIKMSAIDKKLRRIRQIYDDATKQGKIRVFEYQGTFFMPDRDSQVEKQIDTLKFDILKLFRFICDREKIFFDLP